MIKFRKIKWKNFLSTGNTFTEIELDNAANALIIGDNGAGKSTLLDALCFVLFGKAFRSITKPLLVNSVNNKDSMVEVEFNTNGKSYRIIRGMKPNIFEIYCDGTLLNQDSAMKDYQEHLEKFILKMNYKSFTQIVILGSASFTPFMQLKPADRRIVIEELLDIQIFSTMNNIAKQKFQANRENIEKNRLEINGKEEKKSFITKMMEKQKANNQEKLKVLNDQYFEHRRICDDLKVEKENLEKERDLIIEKTANHSELKTKQSKFIALEAKIENNLSRNESHIDFYHNNDNCPTCKQLIDHTFKDKIIQEAELVSVDYRAALDKLRVNINNLNSSLREISEQIDMANQLRIQIERCKNKIEYNQKIVSDFKNQMENLKHSDKMLINNQNELVSVETQLEHLNIERERLLEERLFIDTAISLLKDGGIKTKIIKQYLPIINKHINKYLAQMGFFVNFNINEQFEETIKSRHRDEFSYHNFSEGEKTRIDLALLFTWRAIARKRNSVNTNLLILDEVLDGSLDSNGTDEFLKIMWNMIGDTNTFVISHKSDMMIDKFEKVYKFVKVKNFSELKE